MKELVRSSWEPREASEEKERSILVSIGGKEASGCSPAWVSRIGLFGIEVVIDMVGMRGVVTRERDAI